MIQPDQHLDAEMLSAWLDTPDEFSEQDRLAIENHLAGCAECSQVAAELTAIVRAFQTLPFVEPERSFSLTPEAAGLVATPTLPSSRRLEEPSHLHERALEKNTRNQVDHYEPIPWYERQMRALRWATTVAAMLFVLFVSVDVLGNIDGGSDDADESAAFSEAPIPTQAAAASGAAATNTTASGMAAPEEEADESARGAEEDSVPDASSDDDVAGSAPEPTSASDASGTTGGAEAEEESPPADAAAEATAEDANTMMVEVPSEPEQADQAQPNDESVSAYSGKDMTEERQESNTLHLIELALLIAIAWLIVAMIALPRLRRPPA